uniref:Uncharacterized protein n=1 Tax=Pyrodinium bahamense TaxID=73915 RepID=A0A7S0ASF7_9DINO
MALGLAARRLGGGHCHEEEEEEPDYAMGFLLTVGAGLAKVLGCAAIPMLRCGNERKLMAVALGFASGVMLWISVVNILGSEAPGFFKAHFVPNQCGRLLGEEAGEGEHEDEALIEARLCMMGCFFAGALIATGIKMLATRCFGAHAHDCGPPAAEGQDCIHPEGAIGEAPQEFGPVTRAKLKTASLVSLMAMTMHNFPEGLATFFGGGAGSFFVPIAIAVHNIPEGMAVALPQYQASRSFVRAAISALVAGMAQPVGAAIGWLLIATLGLDNLPGIVYGVMFAFTAGYMVCVAVTELLPHAFASAPAGVVSASIFAGFLLMEVAIIAVHAGGGHGH